MFSDKRLEERYFWAKITIKINDKDRFDYIV